MVGHNGRIPTAERANHEASAGTPALGLVQREMAPLNPLRHGTVAETCSPPVLHLWNGRVGTDGLQGHGGSDSRTSALGR